MFDLIAPLQRYALSLFCRAERRIRWKTYAIGATLNPKPMRLTEAKSQIAGTIYESRQGTGRI